MRPTRQNLSERQRALLRGGADVARFDDLRHFVASAHAAGAGSYDRDKEVVTWGELVSRVKTRYFYPPNRHVQLYSSQFIVAEYTYPRAPPSSSFSLTAMHSNVVVRAVRSSTEPPPRGSHEV